MGDWRAWVTGSAGAVRISWAVCAIAAVGLATALVLATLAVDRSLGPTVLLLVVSFPVVFAGQAWVIAVQTTRGNGVVFAERRPRLFSRRVGVPVFESLPVWCTYALLVIGLLGWVAAMTSFPSLWWGNPTSSAPGCPYRLVSHGDFTCVSRATYIHVGAAEERFVAGIVGFFFALHLTMGAAELARRRAATGAPPG